MVKLKSRTQCPPGGFIFFQPETNYQSEVQDPSSQWDFKLLCRNIQKMRQANPRFNLNSDMNAIEEEVDYTNALRMLSIPGADYYITHVSTSSNVPKKMLRPLRRLQAAVEGGAKLISGISTILEMFGADGPGDKSTAESRATICSTCKWNDKGDWTRFFTEPAQAVIRTRLSIIKDLDLTTSKDSELQTCTICDCPLKLKMFARIQHILAHMPEKVRKDIKENAGWCWINSESQ